MNRKSRWGKDPSPGPDDGPSQDPLVSKFFHPAPKAAFERKARQLCEEVRRTLEFALDWECDDDLLAELWIAAVDPAPDASRLRVSIEIPPGRDPVAVLERLDRMRPRLRAEVARAVTRKRAPDFFFAVGSGGDA